MRKINGSALKSFPLQYACIRFVCVSVFTVAICWSWIEQTGHFTFLQGYWSPYIFFTLPSILFNIFRLFSTHSYCTSYIFPVVGVFGSFYSLKIFIFLGERLENGLLSLRWHINNPRKSARRCVFAGNYFNYWNGIRT